MAWFGTVRQGVVRYGPAGRGSVRSGRAWFGPAVRWGIWASIGLRASIPRRDAGRLCIRGLLGGIDFESLFWSRAPFLVVLRGNHLLTRRTRSRSGTGPVIDLKRLSSGDFQSTALRLLVRFPRYPGSIWSAAASVATALPYSVTNSQYLMRRALTRCASQCRFPRAAHPLTRRVFSLNGIQARR